MALQPVFHRKKICVCFRFRFGYSCLLCLWAQTAEVSAPSLDLRVSLPDLSHLLTTQMYRAPVGPQRSPGATRPGGRFPSPSSSWGFRSPYGGSGHRGGSPRGGPAFPPGSPVYSPCSNRGHRLGSPAGLGNEFRRFRGQMWHRSGGFRRPPDASPASAQKLQGGSSDSSVEKYFSPSMLQDPWAALQPIAAADRQTAAY
uniref:M-phase-specific PLK1-interacting protein n=1 Tax=Scatophagus argus TaxID=75038 RepID=UPI001ED80CBA|nr:M-phase-specific PLK1-interacting protein [Scatophagus argus]